MTEEARDDERKARTEAARLATTPDGRLEYHLLNGEAVTMYPYWAADLRAVIAGYRKHPEPEITDEMVIRADDAMLAFRSGTQHEMLRTILAAALQVPERHITPAPLDPEPWSNDFGNTFRHNDPNVIYDNLAWTPREGYEQDYNKYPGIKRPQVYHDGRGPG